MAQFVTLVNRSSKTLTGTWDGKQHSLAPGKHAFPIHMALKFKDQNPVMGSEDLRTGLISYLMGIEEENDDCSPIEQSDAIERWTSLPGRNVETVPGKNGLFSARDLQRDAGPAGSLPLEPGFVKA